MSVDVHAHEETRAAPKTPIAARVSGQRLVAPLPFLAIALEGPVEDHGNRHASMGGHRVDPFHYLVDVPPFTSEKRNMQLAHGPLVLLLVGCGATGLGVPIFEEADASPDNVVTTLDAAVARDAAVTIADVGPLPDSGVCNTVVNIGAMVPFESIPEDAPIMTDPTANAIPDGTFTLRRAVEYMGAGNDSVKLPAGAQTWVVTGNLIQVYYLESNEKQPYRMTMQVLVEANGINLHSTCGDRGDAHAKLYLVGSGFTLVVKQPNMVFVANYDRAEK